MTEQKDFSNMTLQALAIHCADVAEELGEGFEPVAMGDYGSMTLAEFQALIDNALQAGLLNVCLMGEQKSTVLDAYNDGGRASQNGPAVQICFDAASVSWEDGGTVVTFVS